MIKVEQATKKIGNNIVLKAVNLDFQEGKFMVFVVEMELAKRCYLEQLLD